MVAGSTCADLPSCRHRRHRRTQGDELLYAAGNKLIAITGNQHSGQILWEWTGPANLSMPAIADVDDDGWAELVVQAADGTVYCLDSEK